jgi:hypothetical protein
MKYLGAFLLLVGIVSVILNIIQVNNIKKSCGDNKEVKNINYGNGVLSIIVILIGGMILFYKDQTVKLGFG